MLKRIKFLLAVLVFVVNQPEAFSQKTNFTGTWVLNMEKSILESRPEGLTGSVFVIQQNGEEFKLARSHIFGEKRKKISFKMTADGRTRMVKLLFKGKLEWREDNLEATLWRKNFQNIVMYKFGDTKNEFIADEVFKGNPKNHHNIWVFDKDSSK